MFAGEDPRARYGDAGRRRARRAGIRGARRRRDAGQAAAVRSRIEGPGEALPGRRADGAPARPAARAGRRLAQRAVPPPVPPIGPMLGCTGEGPVPVEVRAWGATPTCVYLKAGETAEITATGRWKALGGREVGPEGDHAGRGRLPARGAGGPRGQVPPAHLHPAPAGSITAQRDGYVWLYQSGGWNAMESERRGHAPPSTGGGRSTAAAGGADPAGRRSAGRSGPHPGVRERVRAADDPGALRGRRSRITRACAPTSTSIYGGDPVKVISRGIVVGCALFYATPADLPQGRTGIGGCAWSTTSAAPTAGPT